MAWVRREGLLDKNCRPPEKTVVETKVYVRGKVAELNRKVSKLETCIAKNEEQQTTKKTKINDNGAFSGWKVSAEPTAEMFLR